MTLVEYQTKDKKNFHHEVSPDDQRMHHFQQERIKRERRRRQQEAKTNDSNNMCWPNDPVERERLARRKDQLENEEEWDLIMTVLGF